MRLLPEGGIAGGTGWQGTLVANRVVAVLGLLLLILGLLVLAPRSGVASTDRSLGEATGRSLVPVSLMVPPAWAEAVARMARMQQATPCTAPTFGACPFREFQRALFRLEGRSAVQKLAAVHRLANAVSYISDMENYGRADYWASPRQFFYRGGDCEDYAIAKMWALIQLGFAPDTMRVLILRHPGRGVDHAVLQVELDGSIYILDNEKAQIGGAVLLQGFETIFAVGFATRDRDAD